MAEQPNNAQPQQQPNAIPIASPNDFVPASSEGSTFKRDVQKTLDEHGATVGMLAGGALGTPIGPLGIAAGAGLGAAAGKATAIATRHFLTPEDVDQSLPGIAKDWSDTVKEGLLGATFEAGGQALSKGIAQGFKSGATVADFGRKVGSRMVESVGNAINSGIVPTAKGIIEDSSAAIQPVIRRAKDLLNTYGYDMTLGQLSGDQKSLWQTIENVARDFIGTQKGFRKYIASGEAAVMQATNDILGPAAKNATPGEAAVGVLDIISGQRKQILQARKVLFDNFKAQAPNANGDLQPVLDYAMSSQDVGIKQNVLQSIFGNGFGVSRGRGGLQVSIPNYEGDISKVPFETLQNWANNAHDLGMNPDKGTARIARYVEGKIYDVIGGMNEVGGTNGKQMLDAAYNFSKTEVREKAFHPLVNEFVNHLTDQPSVMSSYLMKQDSAAMIAKLRNIVGDVKFTEKVRPQLVSQFLNDVADPTTKLIDGNSLLNKLKSVGPDTVREAFNVPYSQLEDLGNAMKIVQARPEASRISIHWVQGLGLVAATGALATGHVTPMHVGVVGTTLVALPQLANKILLNRKFLGMVNNTLKYEPGNYVRTMSAIAKEVAQSTGQQVSDLLRPATPSDLEQLQPQQQ